MSYKVNPLPDFARDAKRLSKKYPSIKHDLRELILSLVENPFQGTPIGKHCYKIKLHITSKGKGKSGGGRVISNIAVIKKEVYLLTLYDKSEKENISDIEILKLINQIEK